VHAVLPVHAIADGVHVDVPIYIEDGLPGIFDLGSRHKSSSTRPIPGLTTVRDPSFSPPSPSLSACKQHPLVYFTTPVVTATSSTTMRFNAVIMINLPVILLALAAGSLALPRMADANPWPERRETFVQPFFFHCAFFCSFNSFR
jgi:hypothetical protein